MIQIFCVALLLSAPSPPAPAPCCYTHPQHAGTCSVPPAEGETCASILAFLNNPQSQGKSYCGNTSVRGGWKLVKCASPKAAPSPSPTPH